MKKEEIEEQFNKEAKQGWKSAAGAARITDEIANSERLQAHIGLSFCGGRQQPGSSRWYRRGSS